MSSVRPLPPAAEKTPVDDVRQIREKLSRETAGNIDRLIRRARETTETLRDKLGLKPAGL